MSVSLYVHFFRWLDWIDVESIDPTVRLDWIDVESIDPVPLNPNPDDLSPA